MTTKRRANWTLLHLILFSAAFGSFTITVYGIHASATLLSFCLRRLPLLLLRKLFGNQEQLLQRTVSVAVVISHTAQALAYVNVLEELSGVSGVTDCGG